MRTACADGQGGPGASQAQSEVATERSAYRRSADAAASREIGTHKYGMPREVFPVELLIDNQT